jgi:hypothetical protein
MRDNASWRRTFRLVPACVAVLAASLAAQSPYTAAQLDGARFDEQVNTDVMSRSGTADVHRVMARSARYGVGVAADTVIVTADSLMLSQTTDGAAHDYDVNGVVGGHWKFFVDSAGRARIVASPFVPDAIAEVSDLTTAMDDFLPPRPPPMQPRTASDADHRRWQRLADSAGMARYTWVADNRTDTQSTIADTVAVHVKQTSHEESQVVWDPVRGPVRWERRIHVEVRARLVDAVVTQHVTVVRE